MTASRHRVLVVGASIRASTKDAELGELVAAAGSWEALLEALGRKHDATRVGLCNSEILAAAALFGAREEGAEIDYFSLRRLFTVGAHARVDCDPNAVGLDAEICVVDTNSVRKPQLDDLLERVGRADAVVLASPVYFGDRSSVADTFLKILHRTQALSGKGYATLSVGAKRNGGQETANVYSLFDAINMGALGVGNGPKTSQYGGTAVAGDRGAVLSDAFGLETSLGTGRRSAQLARILKLGAEAKVRADTKIAVVITADNESRDIEVLVQALADEADLGGATLELVNLIDYRVERCLACKICPYPPMVATGSKGKTECGHTDYACVIDNGKDRVEIIRERLKGMDGLIIAGVNDDSVVGLVDQYQAFTERTRFIRRSDFEWMNTPFTSLIFKKTESSRERVFGLRVMTSYMRHNTIAVAPLRSLSHDGRVITSPVQGLTDFVRLARKIRGGRDLSGSTTVSYIAGGTGGYADTTLDSTSAQRS